MKSKRATSGLMFYMDSFFELPVLANSSNAEKSASYCNNSAVPVKMATL